jgi:tryptophanyl-tRNA synthetase
MFFLEDDDKLQEIKEKYGKGEMLTGEVKKILIEVIQEFVRDFQERRKKVTDDDVNHFMQIRKINPFPKRFTDAHTAYEVTNNLIKPPNDEETKQE